MIAALSSGHESETEKNGSQPCHSAPGSTTRHGPVVRWGRDRHGALSDDQSHVCENAVRPEPCRSVELGRRVFGADSGCCLSMLSARARGQQDGSHGSDEKGIGFTLGVTRHDDAPSEFPPASAQIVGP